MTPFQFDKPIPIASLLAEDRRTPSMEAVRLLAPAEIILGRWTKTKKWCVLYGRERLKKIWEVGGKSGARMLTIALDKTEDLKLVAGVIEAMKGSFEFEELSRI